MATKEESRRIEGRFLAWTLIIFAILSFLVLREFIYYVIGGILLVFTFLPIHRRIKRVVRHNASASFISFLLVGIVLVGPLVLVGFLIYDDAKSFVADFDAETFNATIQERVLDPLGISPGEASGDNESVVRPSSIANWLAETIISTAENIGREMAAIAPGLALGLVIAGFITYYGFSQGEEFYTWFRRALPLPDEIEDRLFDDIRKITKIVFVGNILVSVLGGIIGAISFLIFGVPNAIFWGFIMIILGILPVVGAPMVWIPAALWLFIDGHPASALGILIVNGLIVVGYVDNILRPKMIGLAANVHPVLILVGVLGGLEAFGPLGFVIGPLVLAIFIALVRSYTEWHPRWVEGRLEYDSKPARGSAKRASRRVPIKT